MHRFVSAFSCLLLLAASAVIGNAQARTTASKSSEISVFGGFSSADPGYGTARDTGGAVGVDFTRFVNLPIIPSTEIRATMFNGPTVNEKAYLVGARLGVPLHSRIHPYADFLVGKGTIHYTTYIGRFGDDSLVYNYGGGINYDVTQSFQAKLDFQAQHWNTGGTDSFSPSIIMVGINYRIPFRRYVSQRDLR